MTSPTESLLDGPSLERSIAQSRERFVRDTESHALTILRDDELYRHLRFKAPTDSTYWFDITTWPGYLALTGDCGSYLFSRTRDMFEFFAPSGARGGFDDARWGINPQYWSEKLRAPAPPAAQRFSEDVFKARVGEWLKDAASDLEPEQATALRQAVDEQLLNEIFPTEQDAHRLLYEFDHNGTRIYESWDWHLREYEWSYLWCCWAIVWGIGKYQEADRV